MVWHQKLPSDQPFGSACRHSKGERLLPRLSPISPLFFQPPFYSVSVSSPLLFPIPTCFSSHTHTHTHTSFDLDRKMPILLPKDPFLCFNLFFFIPRSIYKRCRQCGEQVVCERSRQGRSPLNFRAPSLAGENGTARG